MSAREGLTVVHRRYVPYSHAHYAGNLVDGAYVLGLFGDVATEVCIRTDGDEGLFASYSDVQFVAPVRAGDVLEVEATVTRVGPPQPRAGARGARGLPGARRRVRRFAGRPPRCWPSRSSSRPPPAPSSSRPHGLVRPRRVGSGHAGRRDQLRGNLR